MVLVRSGNTQWQNSSRFASATCACCGDFFTCTFDILFWNDGEKLCRRRRWLTGAMLKQDAQLSQRDRAAGCVSFGRQSKNGTGIPFVADIIGLCSTSVTQSASKAIEFNEKSKTKAITPFKVIQGHSRSSSTISIESPYATSY